MSAAKYSSNFPSCCALTRDLFRLCFTSTVSEEQEMAFRMMRLSGFSGALEMDEATSDWVGESADWGGDNAADKGEEAADPGCSCSDVREYGGRSLIERCGKVALGLVVGLVAPFASA